MPSVKKQTTIQGVGQKMKLLGFLMVLIAGIVIICNVITSNENERTIQESPWTTLLSGGANLKTCYTFTPPYTGFEVFIMAVGGLGLVFLCLPRNKKSKTDENN